MTIFFHRMGYNRRQRIRKRVEKVRHALYLCWRWTYRRGILYALALGGLGFGIQQGRNQLPELNPLHWKNLKTIEVEGNRMLTFEDIVSTAELDSGMFMDSISESRIQEKLLGEAWISSVKVAKKFPSTVTIEVQESKPVMSSFEAGRWVVYSENGAVLPLSTMSAYKYPVVSVSTREEREVCAKFLFVMQKSDPALYGKVSQVAVSAMEQGIEVFFSDVRFKVLFSMDGEWEDRVFKEYRKMVRSYSEDLKNADVLDLRFGNFAYLRSLGYRRKNG